MPIDNKGVTANFPCRVKIGHSERGRQQTTHYRDAPEFGFCLIRRLKYAALSSKALAKARKIISRAR